MRLAFIQTLTNLAKRDKRMMLLTGDLGFTILEEFAKEFPERFINCGVAEANMVGVAAGLAHEGFIPFVYSIAPFTTLRPLEQIRNDVCFHNLPVKIVGVGGGLAYGHAGSTHHVLEDIAIMRSLPNMTVVVPADPEETRQLVMGVMRHKGPVYFRLGKVGEPTVHQQSVKMHLGKGHIIVRGSGVVIFACGSMVVTSLEIHKLLQKQGMRASLVSLHTIKPLDTRLIQELTKDHHLFVTVEEHSIIGGLGAGVAESLSSYQNVSFQRFGIEDCYVERVGSQKHLHHTHGLSTKKIARRIMQEIKKQKAKMQIKNKKEQKITSFES